MFGDEQGVENATNKQKNTTERGEQREPDHEHYSEEDSLAQERFLNRDYREESPRLHNNVDVNRIFETMMIENRRRVEAMERLFERLTPQQTPLMDNANLAIMPEILRHIGAYDGDPAKAKVWLESLDSAQNLHRLPSNYMLETARTRLVDGAKYWYLTKQENIRNWEDFVTNFKASFYPRESTAAKFKKMEMRIQRKGENINLYYHEKVKLCKDLKLEFSETKEQVLIGLFSKSLCDAMWARRHSSTDELLQDLQAYEEIESSRRQRFDRKTTQPQVPRRDSHPDSNVHQSQATVANETGRTNSRPPQNKFLPPRNAEGKPLCFKCKRYGHVSKYCSSPARRPIAPSSNGSTRHVQETENREVENVDYQRTTSPVEDVINSPVVKEDDKPKLENDRQRERKRTPKIPKYLKEYELAFEDES